MTFTARNSFLLRRYFFSVCIGMASLVPFFSAVGQVAPTGFRTLDSSLKEGKLVFKIEYQDSILDKNPIREAAFPSEIIQIFKGDFFRTEIQSDYTHSSILGNMALNSIDSYMELLHKKLQLTSNLDTMNIHAYNRNQFTIEYSKERKNILGYSCIKAFIRFSNPNMKDAVLYYTPSIRNYPLPITQAFYKIPGMILEIYGEYQGVNVHIMAHQIQKISIPTEYFTPPDGYQKVTMDEFIKKVIKP